MNRHRLVVAAWAILVLGLAVRAFSGGLLGRSGRGSLEVRPYVVDVNTADVHELRVLPGIGLNRAEAIVLERIRNGPFQCAEDLGRVDGIGPATVAALRDLIVCGERRDGAVGR